MSIPSSPEQLMLNLINQERAGAGIAPLTFSDTLNDASEDHSSWMLNSDTFEHTGVGGSSPHDRMVAAGYDFSGPWRSGENIAFQSERGAPGIDDDVVDLHNGLMNSPGHRANILNPNFTQIGIGIEEGLFTTGSATFSSVMVTQNFAFSTGSNPAPGSASTPVDQGTTDPMPDSPVDTPDTDDGSETPLPDDTGSEAPDMSDGGPTADGDEQPDMAEGGGTEPGDQGEQPVEDDGDETAPPEDGETPDVADGDGSEDPTDGETPDMADGTTEDQEDNGAADPGTETADGGDNMGNDDDLTRDCPGADDPQMPNLFDDTDDVAGDAGDGGTIPDTDMPTDMADVPDGDMFFFCGVLPMDAFEHLDALELTFGCQPMAIDVDALLAQIQQSLATELGTYGCGSDFG